MNLCFASPVPVVQQVKPDVNDVLAVCVLMEMQHYPDDHVRPANGMRQQFLQVGDAPGALHRTTSEVLSWYHESLLPPCAQVTS